MNFDRKDLLKAAWIIGICFVLGSCTIAGAIGNINNEQYEQERFNNNFERYIEILENERVNE